MATSKQEAQWVLRAQCDDREALEHLLRSVQPSPRKLKWLDEPALFRAWAFRVASRVAFRHLKKAKRESTRALHFQEELSLPEVAAILEVPLSEDLESILKRSLNEVDRSQKWQIGGLIFFVGFSLLHIVAFIGIVHGGDESSPLSRHAIAMGLFSTMLMVVACTFGIMFFITRMTKKILRAVELSSKP